MIVTRINIIDSMKALYLPGIPNSIECIDRLKLIIVKLYLKSYQFLVV
jgi:hypothetical protein